MKHAKARAWARGYGMVLLVLMATAPADGASRRAKECRSSCDEAIAVCQQGYRKRFCTREVRALCRLGRDICTAPLPSGACLGAAACSLRATNVTSTVGSAAELRRRLLGLWYDCKRPSSRTPFGGEAAAGIEFTEDGNWYFLRFEGSTPVRKADFGDAGSYDIIDTSSMNGPGSFHLTLNLNTGGQIIAVWSLAETPQILQLDNMGVQTAVYAHMPGAPACAPICLPPP